MYSTKRLQGAKAEDFSSSVFKAPNIVQQARGSFAQLSTSEQEEWNSLGGETDPELFWPSLLSFGFKLESRDKTDAARSIYSFAIEHSPEDVRSKAQARIDAMEGRGNFGAQAPILVRRFTKDALSPAMILPMMLGSTVCGLTKGWALGRFASAAASTWWMRGSAGKLIASFLGYAAEVPAFSFSSRLFQSTKGIKDAGLGEELASAAITLGILKAGGAFTQSWLAVQTSLFFGMATAHKIEEGLGLRPKVAAATAVTDILSSMLSLGIGASLGHRLLGRGFAGKMRELNLRIGQSGPRSPSPPWIAQAGLQAALADGPAGPSLPQLLETRNSPIEKPAAKFTELSDQLKVFERHQEKIYRKLDEVFSKIDEDQALSYLNGLDRIIERRKFWIRQQEQLLDSNGEENSRFAQDIEIGLNLLQERLLRLGAEIFQEPLPVEKKPRWGLNFRPKTHAKTEPVEKPDALEKTPPGSLAALVNRDVGYGRDLSLREHQIAALYAIRGRIKLLQAFFAEGEIPDSKNLAGTVVMPVGGGKTRTMVASFAAGLELGWVKAGDKLVILNHTDKIHEQNLKVTKLLGPYFKKVAGRPLKISEYKAGTKDLGGDVVVVSIPTIQGESGRQFFREKLRESLGLESQVAMVAVDEVHHLGLSKGKTQETWAEAIAALRQVTLHFLELGFTATPTGKEAGRIFRLREQELMQARVTPRTYLVNVEGINLNQLKVTAGGEFEQRALQSTLLGHPERNQRIFDALTKHGMRQAELSPSGKARLQATIVFAQDLAHGRDMAEGYVRYFQQGSTEFSDRKLLFLGQNRGQIGVRELDRALQAYRQGEIDGIVALVSGITSQKDPILEAVTRGEIEAVFTVDALVEGADLYMFRHQIGGRPTFSRFKKGQERGRVNRRAPDEVSADGQLLQDPPRILFDVIDRYTGERSLTRYGEVMGVAGHTQLESGQLLDAFSGQFVNDVDPGGDLRKPPAPGIQPASPPKTAVADSDWTSLIQKLREVLEKHYDGDIESMSWDLGSTEFFVESLLKGEGWENNRWFLKRLGTLLYQERGDFLQVHREPYISAFRAAIAQIEAQEKMTNYLTVAKLAHQIYCQDLPEAERPSSKTFQHHVLGDTAYTEILALLEASPWIEKRPKTLIDKTKRLAAFQQALGQIAAEQRTLNPTALAPLAYQIYIQDIPEAEQPRPSTFRGSLTGTHTDSEILALLEASPWIEKRQLVEVDKTKRLAAFQQALSQIAMERRALNKKTLTSLAHQIYSQDLLESERPTLAPFWKTLSGKQIDPEILALVEASPWIEKKRKLPVDKRKRLAAFHQALKQIEVEERNLNPRTVATLAHQIYSQEVTEAERPSLKTFLHAISGAQADSEILALLEASPRVEKKRHTPVDKAKRLEAFQQAMRQIEAEQRIQSPAALTRLALQFYNQEIPETERPTLNAFLDVVFGDRADPEISALIEASSWIERQQHLSVDKAKQLAAIHQALRQIETEQRTLNKTGFASFVHQIYNQDLPESERPHFSSIWRLLSGPEANPDILALVEASPWIEKQKFASADKAKRKQRKAQSPI